MKNPYINRTRISARQFRKFLALFCKDFNAIQIADLMHWNRNTANLWINLVRERILTLVEQEAWSITPTSKVKDRVNAAREVKSLP